MPDALLQKWMSGRWMSRVLRAEPSGRYLLVVSSVYISFFSFKLANLVPKLLCYLDTGGQLIFHAALIGVQFIQPGLRRTQS